MLRTFAGKGSLIGAFCAVVGALLSVGVSMLALREFAAQAYQWPAELASAAMHRVEMEGDKTLTIAQMMSLQMGGSMTLPVPTEQVFTDLSLHGLYAYDMEVNPLSRVGGELPESRNRMMEMFRVVRRGQGLWWLTVKERRIVVGAAVPIDRSLPCTRVLVVVRDLGEDWLSSVADKFDIPVVSWSFGHREQFHFYEGPEGLLNNLTPHEEDQVLALAQGSRSRMIHDQDALMFIWDRNDRSYRIHAVPLFSPDTMEAIGVIGVAWDMGQMVEVRNRWMWMELVAVGIAFVLGGALSFLVWRPVSQVIFTLTERLKTDPVGKGLDVVDLEGQAGPARGLALACHRLVREGRSLLEQTSVLGDAILNSAQKQSSCAAQMSSATEELSAMVEQASRAVAHEAGMVQELTDAVGWIKDRASETSKGTADAVVSSRAMMDAAKMGGEQTNQAMDKMEEITEAISGASSEVRKLRDTAHEIVGILNSMTDIAAQTRLLALNAEIEAARAGKQGREFTVVAEEVEVLADESSAAVDQISHLVEEIQTKGELAGKAMLAGMSLVEEGRTMVNATRDAIEEIIKAVQETTHLVGLMADSAMTQVRSAEEANKIVSELASVAEGNASAMEEASASSDEQAASMDQVVESAVNLLSSARAFRAMLSTYISKEKAIAELEVIDDVEEGIPEGDEVFPWEGDSELNAED